ncbi:unnamed protein product [Mytilus coruscus]|uniref:DUF4218 domain-containing protein n=1 Tax=Mytilus coruscus TaxID=42192 RepID=A0A6J8BLB6_MYTCO|nr:unnamed protein product [Mytilus coruscus]
MLGKPQRESLINCLCLLEEANGSTIDMDKFDGFEKRWHQGLCMLERDFPTFYFHLLHHLPQNISTCGPPKNFWMFPYERFNHTLTESISNNQHPEVIAGGVTKVAFSLPDSSSCSRKAEEKCRPKEDSPTERGNLFHTSEEIILTRDWILIWQQNTGHTKEDKRGTRTSSSSDGRPSDGLVTPGRRYC